jgi:hypothetical protein
MNTGMWTFIVLEDSGLRRFTKQSRDQSIRNTLSWRTFLSALSNSVAVRELCFSKFFLI